MKEKIKNFLIPWQENLDKKWWHRFISIIIYGSTICVAVFLSILVLIAPDSLFWRSFGSISLFKEIGIIILFTFIWFIFWESIVYRIILYIVYGKNKTI
jgi:hypothetical protein